MFTDGAAVAELTGRLRAAGCVFAEEEAGLLLEAAGTEDGLSRLVERRLRGVPLEHLLGWAEFDGLRIAIEEGVFVPRRRSQLLVAEAVAHAHDGGVVVDLCCGSGALGAAVRHRVPPVEIYAADIDPRAVACARRNLPPERVFCGDLFDALPAPLQGAVDVFIVNAPYVPTEALGLMPREAQLYEPRHALDGGPDGLDLQRRVATGAAGWLQPGGVLIMETSAPQAAATRQLLLDEGFSVRLRRSVELEATIAVARAPEV